MRHWSVLALVALLLCGPIRCAQERRVGNASDAAHAPGPSSCVPAVQCAGLLLRSARLRAQSAQLTVCRLPSGAPGLLCPAHLRMNTVLLGRWSARALRDVKPAHVWVASAVADRQLARAHLDERLYPALDQARSPAAFAHAHSVLVQLPPEAEPAAAQLQAAMRAVWTAQELWRRRGATPQSCARDGEADCDDDDDDGDGGGRQLVPLRGPACPKAPAPCGPQDLLYRRPDGSCNNLQQPRWGAAGTPHLRALPDTYHDGVWEPRRSASGAALPSPRRLSTFVFADRHAPHPYASLLVMLFGQVVAHDMLLTPSVQLRNGGGVQCCADDGSEELPAERRHWACMPIAIPPDDYFFAAMGKRCMNFVRSQLGLRADCQLAPALQANQVTHVVDASVLYGSAGAAAQALRQGEGGRLRAEAVAGRELPPQTRDPPSCAPVRPPRPCFLTGDVRGNQMVGLVAMARLLLRHHNGLATALHALNPRWGDERLFQEARRIVAAQLQHLLYAEWLPVVLGRVVMTDYRLWPLEEGYSEEYDPDVDPTTALEFATAAFRFGHSTVSGFLDLFHKSGGFDRVLIPQVVFNPSLMLHPPFSDEFFSAMASEPMQRADHFATVALTNYLFNDGGPSGVDLIAINIQRGRDHGLPTYDDVRALQGLPRAIAFSDFSDRIPVEGIQLLEKVYESPQDVDFFVGGLLEIPAYDSVVGPSFQGIIADQFSRLKKGDRFYYEFGDLPNSFTPMQLQELRKTSLARILCDFSDGIAFTSVSPHPFLLPSVPGNEPVECTDLNLPRIDLRAWKEDL